ncbi:MAG: hypothetical protein IPK32_07165 [Verrucomicrobiaceae bacterium]|nr:hypothetical protein [Verrucomicrobiaceae bacterium]
MSLLNDILNGFFNPAPQPKPTPRPSMNIHTPPTSSAKLPDTNTKLAISKIAAQIDFASKAYQRTLWPEGASRADLLHDLELMLAAADLNQITVELHAGGCVAHEFCWGFTGRTLLLPKDFDLAKGMELPLLDLKRITGHRLMVTRHNKEQSYAHLLKLNWGTVTPMQQEAGGQFASEHAAAITGGRISGTMRVGDSARHTLVVTSAGDKFAFAQDMQLKGQSVWLNPRHAAPGLHFKIGAKVSAVVVSTPRGLQGRDIRLAA